MAAFCSEWLAAFAVIGIHLLTLSLTPIDESRRAKSVGLSPTILILRQKVKPWQAQSR